MRFSIKTSFLTVFALMLCFIGYSQSEAEQYMLQLLEEENIALNETNRNTNLDNAMKVLDNRKDSGKINESEFQQGISKLMLFENELRDIAIKEKIAVNNKNVEEYQAKKERGETTDMFDLSKLRLKDKLDQGKISQEVYNEKLARLNKNQAERKARKAGN